MQKLHLLLALHKEHKKVFPNALVVGIRNGQSFKDYLVRAALPETNELGSRETCWKKTFLV